MGRLRDLPTPHHNPCSPPANKRDRYGTGHWLQRLWNSPPLRAQSLPRDDNRPVSRRENGRGRMVQRLQACEPVSLVSRHTMPRGQGRSRTGKNPHGKGDYLQERTQSTPPKSSHHQHHNEKKKQKASICQPPTTIPAPHQPTSAKDMALDTSCSVYGTAPLFAPQNDESNWKILENHLLQRSGHKIFSSSSLKKKKAKSSLKF